MGVIVSGAEVGPDDVLGVRLTDQRHNGTGPPRDGEDRQLVLRRRKSGDERRADVGPGGGSVPLPQLRLTPGLWDGYLDEGGQTQRLPSTDPGFSFDRLDAYAMGRHAQEFLAYRTTTGHFAIRVREARPAADVRAVWIREGRLEVMGMLVYTGLSDDATERRAQLILDNGRDRVTHAATVQGVRFFAALSLVSVSEATGEFPSDWRMLLDVEDVDEHLRIGARLDDCTDRQRQTQYPVTRIDGKSLRPVYGDDDDLLIQTR